MSEEQQQPEAQAPAVAPEASAQSARDRAIAALTGHLRGEPEPEPADDGGTEEPPAAAGGDTPPEDSDTRLSRLYAQATEAEERYRRVEASNRELQQQLQELQAFKQSLSDPDKALEALGISPEDIVRKRLGMDKQELTAEQIAQRAAERVEELERREEERQKQQQQDALTQRQSQLHNQVQQFLADNGFHALATSTPAVRNLASRLFREERQGAFKGHSVEAITDYCRKLAESYDKQLNDEVGSYLSAEGAIDRLLANEATAKKIREKLGIADVRKPNGGQATDAANRLGNEPRTISDDIAAQSGGVTHPAANGQFNPSEARRRAMQALARSFEQTK